MLMLPDNGETSNPWATQAQRHRQVLLRDTVHAVCRLHAVFNTSGLLESRASEVAAALQGLEQRTSDKQAANR